MGFNSGFKGLNNRTHIVLKFLSSMKKHNNNVQNLVKINFRTPSLFCIFSCSVIVVEVLNPRFIFVPLLLPGEQPNDISVYVYCDVPSLSVPYFLFLKK